MQAIEIRALKKVLAVGFWGRKVKVLDGVDIAVAPGTAHGLVGANGAGKSTTMRILAGAARPTSGTASIFGVASDVPQARQHFGYAPDTPGVSPTLTGREALAQHAAAIDANATDINRVLEEVELAARADEQVKTYSKGMTQRLALALALVGKPKVLVLDEPMSGLDPPGRELVRGLIRRRVADGVSVLFSSHVIADVVDLCRSVTVIDRGATVFNGTVDAFVGTERTYRLVVTGEGPLPAGLGETTTVDHQTIIEVGDAASLERAIVSVRAAGMYIVSVDSLRPHLEQKLAMLMHSADSLTSRGRT